MASIFGHAILGIGLTKAITQNTTYKILALSVICTIIPDTDVLGFFAGIPYDHPMGHRGFSHSIFFALFFSLFIKQLFVKEIKLKSRRGFLLWGLFFLCTISHSLLDSLTSGGLGVGYFVPFHNERYFFPWRPIQVSPIGIASFFTEKGSRVIRSEAFWVGIPSLVLIITGILRNKLNKQHYGDRQSKHQP